MRKVAALSLAIALALTGCDSAQPLFGRRVVDVVEARRSDTPELLDYPATLEAPARVDVTARTEGYLLERTFEDGSRVEQDRVLFMMQPDAYEARLEAALAELAQREAALELATKAVDRLEGQGEAHDRAKLERASADGAMRESRARVEQAEIDASYTTLRAPIAGRIDRHAVDVGNLIAKGDTLATIVQLDPIYVAIEVPADDVARLRTAHREAPLLTQVVIDGGSVHERTGRVQTFGGAVDPETDRVTVRALVPNPRVDLLAGRPVTARLLLRWHSNTIVVPERAVHADGPPFVLVVGEDQRVERREVELGPPYAGDRVILGGLKEGDRVVVGRSRAAIPGREVRAEPMAIEPQATPRLAPRVTPPTPSPAPTNEPTAPPPEEPGAAQPDEPAAKQPEEAAPVDESAPADPSEAEPPAQPQSAEESRP